MCEVRLAPMQPAGGFFTSIEDGQDGAVPREEPSAAGRGTHLVAQGKLDGAEAALELVAADVVHLEAEVNALTCDVCEVSTK